MSMKDSRDDLLYAKKFIMRKSYLYKLSSDPFSLAGYVLKTLIIINNDNYMLHGIGVT